MRKFFLKSVLCCSAALLATIPARAEGIIDEFRFGGSFVNIEPFVNLSREKNHEAVLAEVLFRPFDFDFRANPSDDFFRPFLTPRFHIGANVDLDGGTDSIYTGLTWHFPVGETVFFETSFGAGFNNGSTSLSQTRASLGSNVLFRESVAAGINIGENFTLLTRYSHQSHANLAGDENDGINNVSIIFGSKF